MRRALPIAALLLSLGWGVGAARAYAGEPLQLEAPPKVDAVKLADVDGDGRTDVLALSKRDLHCPVCRAEVSSEFLVCPVCTTKLKQA